MGAMFIAGLDIGTTNIDLYVLDLEKAEIVEKRSSANPRLSMDDPFAYCQDPALIVKNVRDMLASIKQPLSSLCVTGQQHSILYVDGQGGACSPLYTWLDRHGEEPFRETTPQKLLAEKTGVVLSSGYGFLTHYALGLFGRIPPEARAWTGINEYVTARLLGGSRLTKTDSSILASFGGFDPLAGKFKPDFAAHANGEAAGKLSLAYPETADSFSITGVTPEGVPVAYPAGDNQASFYGLVAHPDEECLINIGTSGQLSLFSKSSKCPAGMDLRPFFGLGYLFVGADINGGKSYETLERFFAEVVRRYAAEKGLALPSDVNCFNIMKAAALEVNVHDSTPHGGLAVDAAFNGTRRNEKRRGSINGISFNNFTMGNLTAATVAGIIHELAVFRTGLEKEFSSIKRIVPAGSAVKNPLFRRELEKQFMMEVRAASGLGAALGAALVGGVSAGLIKQGEKAGIIEALRDKKIE
jgi:sedoheptulokinase